MCACVRACPSEREREAAKAMAEAATTKAKAAGETRGAAAEQVNLASVEREVEEA